MTQGELLVNSTLRLFSFKGKSYVFKGLTGSIVILAFLFLSVNSGAAKQLEEGFVLTGKNLEVHRQDTFEGHTIESMLTPGLKRRLKRDGQKMELCHSQPIPRPEDWKTATKTHADEAHFEVEETEFGARPVLKDHVAGLPFPDVKPGDTLAGYKAMYNAVVGNAIPHYIEPREFWTVLADDENGFERVNRSTTRQYRMYNQWEGETRTHNHVEGDGNQFFRTLVFIISPQNLKGIGTFSIEYWGGRSDDSWIYLRSLRRVRRAPTDNWATRASGLGDIFSDATYPPQIMPLKYPDIEFLETRTILSSWVKNMESYTPPVKGSNQRGVRWVDLNEQPHWNYDPALTCYTPIKVNVVKQTMPEHHSLSHRIVYYDARAWGNIFAEEYDKNEKLWQRYIATPMIYYTSNKHCSKVVYDRNQGAINWKAGHATPLALKRQLLNTMGVKAEGISLQQLRRTEVFRGVTFEEVGEVCPQAIERGRAE